MAVTKSGKDKVQMYMRIFAGGYNLSCDARTFSSLKNSLDQVDVTGWCNSVKQAAPSLRNVGVMGFQAIMNDAAGRSWAVLKDTPQTLPVAILFGGQGEPVIGDPCYQLPALSFGDNVNISDGVAVIQADFLSDPGEATALTDNPLGVLLSPETSVAVTTTGGSVDNEAFTAGGGWAILQVTASDAGTWVFTIEHSTNDSDWSTLITFSADGSAITSEVQTVSGVVKQFTRGILTRTSGTVTAVITFSRNILFGAVSSASLSPSASESPSASVSPSSSESPSVSSSVSPSPSA